VVLKESPEEERRESPAEVTTELPEVVMKVLQVVVRKVLQVVVRQGLTAEARCRSQPAAKMAPEQLTLKKIKKKKIKNL
jgi:hypothetical protein